MLINTKRLEKHIRALSSSFWKQLFCWHDWTIIDGSSCVVWHCGCTKCGITRTLNYPPLEQIDYGNN